MSENYMNFSIPDNLREFVDSQVKEHGYESPSQYVRELLREARDRALREEEFRRNIRLGFEEVRRSSCARL